MGDEYMKECSDSKKIGIMGPFGFGNLGDASIQEAMLQNIYKRFPNAKIYGFSLNPEDTERRHHIPSFPIGRMSKFGWRRHWDDEEISIVERAYYRIRSHKNPVVRQLGRLALALPNELIGLWRSANTLKGFDMFIVSGGGQIDDYWGGPFYHPYTLMVWSLIARYRNVPFYIVSVGAGPLDARLSRLFVRRALSSATYRSYRDEGSKRFVKIVAGYDADDPVYPDLAHSLQVSMNGSKSSIPKTRPIIGLGPMSYFDTRVWPEKDNAVYNNYLNKLADFTEWLIENGYAVLFIAGEAVHDRRTIDDLKLLLYERGVNGGHNQIIDEPIESVDGLMQQLAMTDLVVASRFHGVLLSLLLNKPVVALSYHKKINELMADTGQSDYCLTIDDFQVEVLKERFKTLEVNCEEAKKQIAQRVGAYQAALDEQYEHIFANI